VPRPLELPDWLAALAKLRSRLARPMGSYLDWPPDKFDEQRDADGRIWDEPVVCVYVPHERSFLRRSIRRGSGIVSLPLERGNIEIDFEGNLDGDADLARYVARVARAWDRQSRRSPTIARLRIDAEELLQVGWYETETGLVHVKEWKRLPEAPRILTEWLGLETLPATELGADEENDQAPARRREGMPGLIRRLPQTATPGERRPLFAAMGTGQLPRPPPGLQERGPVLGAK
jgi:hypothetical protein